MSIFARKCEECGHIQRAAKPQGEPTTSYSNAKCRKCGSMSLDYGHSNYEEKGGKLVRKETNFDTD